VASSVPRFAHSRNPSIRSAATPRVRRHSRCCGASGSSSISPTLRATFSRSRPASVSPHTSIPLRRALLTRPCVISLSSFGRNRRLVQLLRTNPKCATTIQNGISSRSPARWRSARSIAASTSSSETGSNRRSSPPVFEPSAPALAGILLIPALPRSCLSPLFGDACRSHAAKSGQYAGIFRNGARGTRTPDLLGAIQALSQLSYSPAHGRTRRGDRVASVGRREKRRREGR
jgi:hypothetical protein